MDVPVDRPRAIAFIDGQNLTYGLKRAFNMQRANFNLPGVVQKVCERQQWDLQQIRFYTGVPNQAVAPDLHAFWMRRLSQLGRQNVWVWTRRNSYSMKSTTCAACGHTEERKVGREKGADMRIALDAARLTHQDKFDVALIFTQDQDFFELVEEIRSIAVSMNREVIVASAFPKGSGRDRGGIRGTMQIPLTRDDFFANR